MKAEARARKAIKFAHNIVNIIVLTVILALVAFAGYALWDSKQIYRAADKANYTIYKPNKTDEGKSFMELQDINPEVIAWLTVYGTNIDYPVTQGHDNMKYVNTNAEGLYSLSGAIFLDNKNNKDFSDYNSILYGHHMEKKAMFGEVGCFSDKNIFDSHRYGNLYFDGKDHGIEFFAFVHTDAYDSSVFTVNVKGEKRTVYLDNLLEKAIHKRDISLTVDDRIVLLSTCSADSTNGRDILVARLTDELFDDPFEIPVTEEPKEQIKDVKQKTRIDIPLWTILPLLVIIILLLRWKIRILCKRRKRENEENSA